MQKKDGFSLLEALISLALAATTMAGVGPVLNGASRSAREARARTTEAILASAKLEQLLSLDWATAPDPLGGPDVLVTDTSTNLGVEPAGTGGPGLRVSGVDTLAVVTPGYADYVDARGRWLGSGPVQGASFLRQWRVDADVTSPGEVLALHVRVRRLDGLSGPQDDGVWLTSLRVRGAP